MTDERITRIESRLEAQQMKWDEERAERAAQLAADQKRWAEQRARWAENQKKWAENQKKWAENQKKWEQQRAESAEHWAETQRQWAKAEDANRHTNALLEDLGDKVQGIADGYAALDQRVTPLEPLTTRVADLYLRVGAVEVIAKSVLRKRNATPLKRKRRR